VDCVNVAFGNFHGRTGGNYENTVSDFLESDSNPRFSGQEAETPTDYPRLWVEELYVEREER
jgi:hypothetical protein